MLNMGQIWAKQVRFVCSVNIVKGEWNAGQELSGGVKSANCDASHTVQSLPAKSILPTHKRLKNIFILSAGKLRLHVEERHSKYPRMCGATCDKVKKENVSLKKLKDCGQAGMCSFYCNPVPGLVNNVLFFLRDSSGRTSFVHTDVHSHCQLMLASARPIGQPSVAADNQPRCPKPTPRPSGVSGLGGKKKRKGREGERWWRLWEKCTWHTDKSQRDRLEQRTS